MYQNVGSDVSASQIAPSILHSTIQREIPKKNWYAVYTHARHEKASVQQLAERGVDVFLPTYMQEKLWKNRQRVKLQLPLFPRYLFVNIGAVERGRVLSAPGVVRILGGPKGPEPVPESSIELLRSSPFKDSVEPQPKLVVGQQARIRTGAMQGVIGTLIRKKNSLWFVLQIELINQRAMIQVRAKDIEPISA